MGFISGGKLHSCWPLSQRWSYSSGSNRGLIWSWWASDPHFYTAQSAAYLWGIRRQLQQCPLAQNSHLMCVHVCIWEGTREITACTPPPYGGGSVPSQRKHISHTLYTAVACITPITGFTALPGAFIDHRTHLRYFRKGVCARRLWDIITPAFCFKVGKLSLWRRELLNYKLSRIASHSERNS